MRICLVTPGHLSTNPRLVKEADALTKAGHKVTVIAADFLPWARAADQAFAAKPWRIRPPLAFGPYAPLGDRVRQLAGQQAARWLVRRGNRRPAVLRTASHQVAKDLVVAAGKTEADLYIAHYTAALPAAALAAKRNRALYAFDAEDFHMGELMSDAAKDCERDIIGAIESLYLPGCVYVTAASPGIADAYAHAYEIGQPAVLLNVFPRSQAPHQATAKGAAVPGPSIYWFSQTIGPNRGLETAIRALGLARSRPHLYLRGLPSKGFAEESAKLARAVGVVDRLHFLAPAIPTEMERLAACYDIGLSGEPGHSLNNRIALANKLFSYLLAGLPIVASDTSAHLQLAPALGEAIHLFKVNDAASLAEGFDFYLLSHERLATARATAFRLGQERFNWDDEQYVLLDCIERALAAPRGADR